MKFNWLVGHCFNQVTQNLLSQRWFPLSRYVPHGLSPWYDAQRYAGKRDFKTIIDAGANIGQTLREISRHCPRAHTFSFEPCRDTHDKLATAFSHQKNISCLNLGLGAREEFLTLHRYKDSERNTLAVADSSSESPTKKERVQITTLDAFTKKSEIESIDFLKMDVQGWEMNILKGAAELLSRNRIHFILSEVGFQNRKNDLQDFSELNTFLTQSRFFLCGFYNHFRWGERKQYLGFTNVLYINPAYSRNPTKRNA